MDSSARSERFAWLQRRLEAEFFEESCDWALSCVFEAQAGNIGLWAKWFVHRLCEPPVER
jgi:hypothetical protein